MIFVCFFSALSLFMQILTMSIFFANSKSRAPRWFRFFCDTVRIFVGPFYRLNHEQACPLRCHSLGSGFESDRKRKVLLTNKAVLVKLLAEFFHFLLPPTRFKWWTEDVTHKTRFERLDSKFFHKFVTQEK